MPLPVAGIASRHQGHGQGKAGQSPIRTFILIHRRTAKISRWICEGKICPYGHGKGIGLRIRTKRNTGQYDFPLYDGDEILANVYGGVVEQTAAANPLKRNARPEDVAGLIEYLFSDKNTFVTGGNFPVTGGEVF